MCAAWPRSSSIRRSCGTVWDWVCCVEGKRKARTWHYLGLVPWTAASVRCIAVLNG